MSFLKTKNFNIYRDVEGITGCKKKCPVYIAQSRSGIKA